MKPVEIAACRATASVSARHNTWRHQLRRRFAHYLWPDSFTRWVKVGVGVWAIVVAFYFALPPLCALAWLHRAGDQSTLATVLANWWLWLSLAFGLLGIVFCGFMLFMKDAVLRAKFRLYDRWWVAAQMAGAVFKVALVSFSLWNGAIVAAVLWHFGLSVLGRILQALRVGSSRSWATAIAALACGVAFALDSQAGFLIALVLGWLVTIIIRRTLREVLRDKLPRSAWLAANHETAYSLIERARSQSAKGGGEFIVYMLINAELWDEALDFLQNEGKPHITTGREIELRAEILSKMNAHERVLQMSHLDRNAEFGAPDILARLVRAHFAMGRNDEALAMAVRAAEEKRKHGELVLADQLLANAHWDEAVLRYDGLLSSMEYRHQAMRGLAQIFMAAGNYRQGRILWWNSLLWSHHFPLSDVLQLARCHACAKQIRDARTALQLATEHAETAEEAQRVEILKHELSPILA